ncbi:hypothetical protein JCM11491_000290 [Sporobolomyces phaffii]
MKTSEATTPAKRGKRAITGDAAVTGAKPKPVKTRQRAPLSCLECRRLKLKCDRTVPCSSCRRRGCPEVCPDGVKKPPGRALEVQAELSLLAKRVEFLETLVTELGGEDRIPPALKLKHAFRKSSSSVRDVESQIATNTYGHGYGDEVESDEGEARMDEKDDDRDDGGETDEEARLVVGVGSLSIGDDEAGRYLGASAAPAYYFDDEDELDDHDRDEVNSGNEGHPVIQLGPSRQKGMEEVESYRTLLPPLERAKELAENYYAFLAFQFVPLSSSEFYDDYLPAAYTPNDPSPTKLGAVYIVLSLGTLFDPEKPSTFNEEAQRYFLRSQNVLAAAKALSHNTLATSQTLQLCGSFLLCQHDLQEGGETFFPLLGIASRLLVTQALHRDGALFGLSGTELNRRRRVFWELTTIERMQAFISGRPYMLQDRQFDTKYPENANDFDIAKWQLGTFIGTVIDSAFSISSPTYSTILKLDAGLRKLVRESPRSLRSGVLPEDAFLEKPQFVPQLPPTPLPSDSTLIEKLQQHTMDQMYSQVLFYTHKPAFAHALVNHPKEPLQSPFRASVEALALETAVYLVAVAKSWTTLHPVLAPRWWHIYFHAFAAAVSQASLVIKCPSSLLAPHSWTQLQQAVAVFEEAGSTGAPCSLYIPRLKVLQEKAFVSLQNLLSIPLGLGDRGMSDALVEGEISRSILNPPVRLERRQTKSRTPTSGETPPDSQNSPPHVGRHAQQPIPPSLPHRPSTPPPVSVPYSPFDAPFMPSLPPQQYPYADAYQGLASLPVPPVPEQHRHSFAIPDYAFPAAPFPLDARALASYPLQPDSRMEFGGFATAFPDAVSAQGFPPMFNYSAFSPN